MRLIDADALKSAMYHEAFETDSDMQKWDSGCWIRYKLIVKCIDAAPTIDPVKRGKWIPNSPFTGNCSECSAKGNLKDNYCSNCGAKMGDGWEEPEINPCRGCDDYNGRGGCGAERSESDG